MLKVLEPSCRTDIAELVGGLDVVLVGSRFAVFEDPQSQHLEVSVRSFVTVAEIVKGHIEALNPARLRIQTPECPVAARALPCLVALVVFRPVQSEMLEDAIVFRHPSAKDPIKCLGRVAKIVPRNPSPSPDIHVDPSNSEDRGLAHSEKICGDEIGMQLLNVGFIDLPPRDEGAGISEMYA